LSSIFLLGSCGFTVFDSFPLLFLVERHSLSHSTQNLS
jgi:hypothetical protein